jgi:hypothetical protein
VFRRRCASASWSKFKDRHPLPQLRSKFWGENIEEEAKQWRESLTAVKVDRTNDIGLECYGLDLGIELKDSTLRVRQDYIRIYDYCSKSHEEGPSSVAEMPHSVVITGQPGVGVFLSPVASCALSNNPSHENVKHIGQPTLSVVVSANGNHSFGIEVASCFLFVEDGGFQQDVESVSVDDFALFLWAFIDADALSTGIPEKLVHHTNLYIMFTSSQKRDRWKTLTKCTDCVEIIMNTWLVEEIRQA